MSGSAKSPVRPSAYHAPLSRASGESENIVAILGPTNTGKTTLAVERMLRHQSGVIGFPLRLLARENYDRLADRLGRSAVGLITGEERILPDRPHYILCTVEAMPVTDPFDFMAVDEIQLCADPERGHIFTERLLRARGLRETLFMGAESMEPALKTFIPGIRIEKQARFSALTYTGYRPLHRMPRRSAVIAFSMDDIYHLGDQIRKSKGGTALVMGALSPETRNAQVAMFQNGEVDYLVATDAIGMGLNMDIDHIALARTAKFDGLRRRHLGPAEMAQIAGRAGRGEKPGSFGVTEGAAAPAPETVEAIENHIFPPITRLIWRNPDPDFRSVKTLISSLETRPAHAMLKPGRQADDVCALKNLAERPEIIRNCQNRADLQLLWQVCQIPDFRKAFAVPDHHFAFLAGLFLRLQSKNGRGLESDEIRRQVQPLDRIEGAPDALMGRLAHIRLWRYISHHPDWIQDALFWQEETRAIENRLSDALHVGLTSAFVDRQGILVPRHKAHYRDAEITITDEGRVLVRGQAAGVLSGLRFQPEPRLDAATRQGIFAALRPVLENYCRDKVRTLCAEPGAALKLDSRNGWVTDIADQPLARLCPGKDWLHPQLACLKTDFLTPGSLEELNRVLSAWLDKELKHQLHPLDRLEAAMPGLPPPARGLCFQLLDNGGCLPLKKARDMLPGLTKPDRQALNKLGIRIGRKTAYLKPLLKPRPREIKAMLWYVCFGQKPPVLPEDSAISFACPGLDPPEKRFLEFCGFQIWNGRAVRADLLERLIADVEKHTRKGPAQPDPVWAQWLQTGQAETLALLKSLGFWVHTDINDTPFITRQGWKKKKQAAKKTT